MRQTGSRNRLITIDYDVIGDLAGIAGDTAKQYAHRGKYDPRDLQSVLRWINSRRAARGRPLIGQPFEPVFEPDSDENAVVLPVPSQHSLCYYDPVGACYRSDDGLGGIACRQ